jgi:hypothetical protein
MEQPAMAGTPDDWTDWYDAGGRALTDLGPETPRIRAARLRARAVELAARLPEETAEAWLLVGESLAARDHLPMRGQAGTA